MNRNIKVAIAQINPRVGAIEYNLKKILKFIKLAKNEKVDLICFPELSLVGYPPEDLLLNEQFLKAVNSAIKKIQNAVKNISFILGYPKLENSKLYNVAGVFINGVLKYEHKKVHLPNYGVFDEDRYFENGKKALIFKLKSRNVCLTICEDIWTDPSILEKIDSTTKPDLLVNISASPFSSSKQKERLKLLKDISRNNKMEIVYSNMVGGQDELVFDGSSIFIDSKGNVISQAKEFKEDLLVQNLNFEKNYKKVQTERSTKKNTLSKIFGALSLGLQDYVFKNGFKKIVLGVSGGVDSALVSAIAVKSLGAKNVLGIAMPTDFNSQLSLDLAKELSKNLGFKLKVSYVQEIYERNLELLNANVYGKTQFDLTEENLHILMAASNKLGSILLSTGNKSETSIGYSTLYGDSAGGLAILKDIPKTMVYDLARFYNLTNPTSTIPLKIISRSPSAELRLNQKDSDSLPPYKVLDGILELYIEQGLSVRQIALQLRIKRLLVSTIVNKINMSEFKRRQGPPGIKVTSKAFGRDRRYPITNGFLEA